MFSFTVRISWFVDRGVEVAYLVQTSTGEATAKLPSLRQSQPCMQFNLRCFCSTLAGARSMWLVTPWYKVLSRRGGLHHSNYTQGGSIAAAFCAWFPHLVDENIAFLAAAGLMNVRRRELFRTSFVLIYHIQDPRFTNVRSPRDIEPVMSN